MYDRTGPSVLFHSLHHAFKRQVDAEQKAFGVEDLGAPIILLTLYYMDRKGQKLSQRELAKRLRRSPATVAVSLKSMERGGYVVREQDEKDQRRNLVSITEKGKQTMERCNRAFQAADEQLFAGFTPQEKEQITGFFIRMLQNLGVTDPEKERPPFPPPPGMEPHGPDCPRAGQPPHEPEKKECDHSQW